MLSRVLLSSFLILTCFFAGAQEPVTRHPGNFNSLSVIGNIRVELYHSDTSRLEVFLDGTTEDNVIAENDEGHLSLRFKTNTAKDASARVKVYYSRLGSLDVQAQALIVTPVIFRGDAMDFTARSGGKMELALDLDSLTADVKQGAILVFSGTVEKQTVEVNTGAAYSAFKLEARDTYVKAVSGGKAKVVARRIIDATASLKGYIGYIGEPVSTYKKATLGGEIVNVTE